MRIGERIFFSAYGAVMDSAALAAGVVAALPGVERRKGLAERLGKSDPERALALAGRPVVWLHAASVGELKAARPLLARLRERFPGRIWLVSTTSHAGRVLAARLPEVHVARLFPLDSPRVLRRLLRALRLELYMFTETELWPVTLRVLAEAGVPAVMVSGRVSAATARRARWLRPLLRPGLERVLCCMQTALDAERIVALGAEPGRVHVTGSLKLDAPDAAPDPGVERAALLLGLDERRAWVAGSTHEGEEEVVLAAHRALRAKSPALLLILAPRHVERVAAVARRVVAAGFDVVRYGELIASGKSAKGAAVALLDTVGPLAALYGLGQVAFVGGTLVPIGGHNLLEPARAARPIVVGPHTGSVSAVAEVLERAGALVRVEDGASLAAAVGRWIEDAAAARAAGEQGRSAAAGGAGALEQHLKIVATRLSAAAFAEEEAEAGRR